MTSYNFLLHPRVCQLPSSSTPGVVTIHLTVSRCQTSLVLITLCGSHSSLLHSLTCVGQSVTFQLSGLNNFPWTPIHTLFAQAKNLALALLSHSIYAGNKYGFSLFGSLHKLHRPLELDYCSVPAFNHNNKPTASSVYTCAHKVTHLLLNFSIYWLGRYCNRRLWYLATLILYSAGTYP